MSRKVILTVSQFDETKERHSRRRKRNIIAKRLREDRAYLQKKKESKRRYKKPKYDNIDHYLNEEY